MLNSAEHEIYPAKFMTIKKPEGPENAHLPSALGTYFNAFKHGPRAATDKTLLNIKTVKKQKSLTTLSICCKFLNDKGFHKTISQRDQI